MLSLLLVFGTMTAAFSQITGKVYDAETNDPLPGATILIEGTATGTVTGFDGTFSLDVAEGEALIVSYLGYETAIVAAELETIVGLDPDLNVLGEVVVSSGVIDIAKVRETPVAVSTISPSEIALKVGNQEFPEIMNKTPGVYATKQGGGYGDSRISLRGKKHPELIALCAVDTPVISHATAPIWIIQPPFRRNPLWSLLHRCG